MTVHRFWHSDAPLPYPVVDNYVARSYHTIDWTFDNLPFDIQDLAVRSAEFVGADILRHYSNVARLYVLLEHGGIYLDHDIIPLTNLEYLPRPFVGSYGGIHAPIWPGVMGFPPEHPMLEAALDRIGDVTEPGNALSVSGFHILRAVLTPDVSFHSLSCDATGLPLPGPPFAFHLGSGKV